MCIAFVYFMIYETKGLTLEQVDELYAEVKDARKSPGWEPTTTFREMRASMAAQGGQGPKGSRFGTEDRNLEKVEENGVTAGHGHHAENTSGLDNTTGQV